MNISILFNPKSVLAGIGKKMNILLLAFFFMTLCLRVSGQSKEEVFSYLRSLGNGSWIFGQVATWVHNENPDMDNSGNWLKKIYDHTGKMPRYGCITYDFDDDPFTDTEWNEGVKKMWERGLIAGVYNFFANPCGGSWKDKVVT